MAEMHQASTLPAGNSYPEQRQAMQEAQQSYGQQGENMAQNYQRDQPFTQKPTENYLSNGHQAPGQNSNQDYYDQKPDEMNGQESKLAGNSGMSGEPGQPGAQYPNSKAPDTLHVWLDRIEKKFGGDRFDETKHPENAAKNAALNESIIKKLKQVMQIVIQRGPSMAMQYGSKLF